MHQLTRIDRIARAGFLARAVVYLMLGWIALAARARADEGQNAVFDELRDMPGGSALLIATAAGLFAYGFYRLATAALDLDGKGNDANGIMARMGALFSGLAHCALGYSALQFLSAIKKSGGADDRSHDAARTLLDLPLGPVLVGVVGAYFLLIAASQARTGWKASFMKQISSNAPKITCTLGRIGHLARAAVFAVIGWSFIRSAWLEDEDQARAIGGALGYLRANHWLFLIVAVGLLVFGVFSLILARYRIVPKVDVVSAAKHKLA